MRLLPRLAVALLAPLLQAASPDLIVVGAGISGLSAALEAARAGLKVTVVEQNSIFGGHAVISSGGLLLIDTPLQQKMKIADSKALALEDIRRWGGDTDDGWARYYVENSRTEIHDWMTALGTEFVAVSPNGLGTPLPRFHSPRGQGLGLVLPVYREILRQGGVTFQYNSRVEGLTLDNGRVTGVSFVDLRSGNKGVLKARHVLLSTGGFAANVDLVRASWPKSMRAPEKFLVGGGFFATGSGMDLAKTVGGVSERLDHQWNYASGLPDPFDPEKKRGFFTFAWNAIWVNAQGKRFAREQHEPKSTIPIIAAQNPARFWAIFDSRARPGFRIVHAGFTQSRIDALFDVPGFIHRAATLEDLARSAGLPAAALKASVDRFNNMIDAGEDSDFGSFGPKVPRSPFGGSLAKIMTPPFYAAPMYILIRKSLGGIKVDHACRVLDADGNPIPGLLASGEATGFGFLHGSAGAEGAFLGGSILMGRVAAQTAAADRRAGPAPSPTRALRDAPPAAHPKLAEACSQCHDLPNLLSARRKGYWHFDCVHETVAERKLNCVGCHAELAPFKAETHKVDRELQIQVCQHCHMSPAFARRAVPD